jgi:hypothetical protein
MMRMKRRQHGKRMFKIDKTGFLLMVTVFLVFSWLGTALADCRDTDVTCEIYVPCISAGTCGKGTYRVSLGQCDDGWGNCSVSNCGDACGRARTSCWTTWWASGGYKETDGSYVGRAEFWDGSNQKACTYRP